MKICCHCKKEKTLGEFGRFRSSKDGRRCECRECRKRHWKKPPEDIEKWKIWRKEHMRQMGLKSKGRKVSEDTKRRKEQTDSIRWKKHDYSLSAKKRIFSHYKRLGFEGSLDQFEKLVTSNCFYCNCEPNVISGSNRTTKHGVACFRHLGLDRIDNIKGYSLLNVVPCCLRCNNAKWIYGYDDFKNWIKKVYINLNSDAFIEKQVVDASRR
jgi:hypothetical protein